MNEEQKNIETCLPEDILSEVANVPTDPQFMSLTDEALDPLKQQALRQAGYDGNKEVVMYHQPYTFTSQVKQMKSNLILLLRRLWRFPFGRGTIASSDDGSAAGSAAGTTSAAGSTAASAAAPIRSLADMWQHYINRLNGNPEYGIPSRLSQLTDLPSAPALLADRKIGGVPEVADGISLVNMITSTELSDSVTELVDDNRGYILDKPINCHTPIFQNLRKVVIGCRENTSFVFYVYGYNAEMPTLEEIEFPDMEIGRDLIDTNAGTSGAFHPGFANVTKLSCPVMQEIKAVGNTVNIFRAFISRWLPSLEHLEFPVLKTLNNYLFGGKALPALKTLRMPKLTNANYAFFNTYQAGDGCPNLILIEVGAVQTNLNISFWSPTNALDASRTDLIEEGSTAANNLEQFLSNFKTYIAERLTDKGKGLTLTLSQEVRNAIHAAEDEYGIENIIITKKCWTISPAPN